MISIFPRILIEEIDVPLSPLTYMLEPSTIEERRKSGADWDYLTYTPIFLQYLCRELLFYKVL